MQEKNRSAEQVAETEVRKQHHRHHVTRRQFMGAAAAGTALATARGPAAHARKKRPNFLFIMADQLGLDALSGHGCPDVHTPNLDRLAAQGVSFLESHSTDPVCSPARSSLLTGRMPTETGVITNDRPIHDSVPDMGQWLRQAGYRTTYCGKWHLPGGYQTSMKGFDVLPVGAGQGDLVDGVVSASCEAFLRNYRDSDPFLLVASFMQPHDICYWAIKNRAIVPEELPFPELADHLPDLPPNHRARPRAPRELDSKIYTGFSDEQWRYYLYIYYRQVEMLDAEVGRLLDALEETKQAKNTVILFTADHGDGRGRHMHVSKWYPYDESVKVPMLLSCPGRMEEGLQDTTHLVSGLDAMSTVCDFAGAAPPPHVLGHSLRPLAECQTADWREFVVADTHIVGRMLRTAGYKYVRYENDPIEQLFDMKADPWETVNIADQPGVANIVADHRRLLEDWESRLQNVPPTPSPREKRKRRKS